MVPEKIRNGKKGGKGKWTVVKRDALSLIYACAFWNMDILLLNHTIEVSFQDIAPYSLGDYQFAR